MSIAETYPRETREFVGVLVFVDEDAFIPTKLQVVRRFDRPDDDEWLDPAELQDEAEIDYGFHLADPWLSEDNTERLGTWTVWAKAIVPGEGTVVMEAGKFTMT